MKRLLSFEDMENGLKDSYLPMIDVKSGVMNRINNDNNKKAAWSFKRITLSMVIISIMLIFTTFGVYAAINGWQLKNKKGDIVYSLENMTYEKYIEWNQGTVEENRLYNLLNNGEAVLIADLKNPEYVLQYMEKPEKIFDISRVKEKAGQDMENIIKIPDGYKFRYAEFRYETKEPDKESREKAIEAAVKKGERYVKIPLIENNTLKSFMMIYNKQLGNHRIEVFKKYFPLIDGPLRGYAYDPENKIEKIVVGDREALYQDKNKIQTIDFADIIDGKLVNYYIIGFEGIPKDVLINAVKEIY
jgi:hypothetical protein